MGSGGVRSGRNKAGDIGDEQCGEIRLFVCTLSTSSADNATRHITTTLGSDSWKASLRRTTDDV